MKAVYLIPVIAAVLFLGPFAVMQQADAGVSPCWIVQNTDSQLSTANHKIQILANNPAGAQPSTLNTINIKIGWLSDRMDKVDPEKAVDLKELQADLQNLIGTAETTQSLAVEFPNQDKDQAITEQLQLIGTNAQDIIDKANGILIGL